MKLTILALGTKMPAWVRTGVAEYSDRLPGEFRIDWRELPLAKRGRGANARAVVQESDAVRRALPAGDRLVVLDVAGESMSTEQLASALSGWQMSGCNYSLVIGGPEGVDAALLRSAQLRWSLSPLTLPHPLVRVLLAEQLYRAWSINAGHPYHRS